jgi:glycerophosphoryl diester phosphodiesterase
MARFCLANGHFLNIEIKPTPGTERRTGEVVAREAARLWQGTTVPPLLTSFQPEVAGRRAHAGAAAPAARAAAGHAVGRLAGSAQAGCSCVAIVCNHALWDAATVGAGARAGCAA